MAANNATVPLFTLGQVLENRKIQLVLINRLYGTATYGAVLWDWWSEFPREWKVWRSRWTLMKVCFLLERYWTLLAGALLIALVDADWTFETCVRLHAIRQIMTTGMTVWGDCILLVRCYALWNWNPIIGLGGLALVLVQATVVLYASIAGTDIVHPPPGADRFTCLIVPNSNLLLSFWVIPFGMDLIFTSLSTYRVYVLRQKGARSNILKTFWKNGLSYFFLVAFLEGINVVFVIVFDRENVLQRVNFLPFVLLTSLLCQRLALALPTMRDGTMSAGASTFTDASGNSGPPRERERAGSGNPRLDTELDLRGRGRGGGVAKNGLSRNEIKIDVATHTGVDIDERDLEEAKVFDDDDQLARWESLHRH